MSPSTINFIGNVYYSTASDEGSWTTIALEVPPGSPDINSIHTYEWTVPDDVDNIFWVLVFQENQAIDYDDVSDDPFAVVASLCVGDLNDDGVVDVTDLLDVIAEWGALKSPADINFDGVVDVTDLLIVVANWGKCA